jgi:hypothetical protein
MHTLYNIQETVLDSDVSDQGDTGDEGSDSAGSEGDSDEEGPANATPSGNDGTTGRSSLRRGRSAQSRKQRKTLLASEQDSDGLSPDTDQVRTSTSVCAKQVPVLDSDAEEATPENTCSPEKEEEGADGEEDEGVPEGYLPTCQVEKIMATKEENGDTFYLLKFKGVPTRTSVTGFVGKLEPKWLLFYARRLSHWANGPGMDLSVRLYRFTASAIHTPVPRMKKPSLNLPCACHQLQAYPTK